MLHTGHPSPLTPAISAADIPLSKAVAGVRVGWLPDEGFVVNPSVAQMTASRLDLLVAGTRDAVLMIEGFCDFMSEEQMLQVGVGGGGRGAVCSVQCVAGPVGR